MPGTEVVFDTNPRYEDPTDLRQYTAPSKVARFRHVDVKLPYVHHDALEFTDGTIVSVARLIQGQWATVLQLPSGETLAESRNRPVDALL